MREWVTWWLYRRWTKRVRRAYRRAYNNKGYLSWGDHEYIRDGSHWALTEQDRAPDGGSWN